MAYAVKEIYYTIQGEGFHTGHAAIFCRFAGCNLWSGLEKDRNTAICQFCDTDFWGTDGVNGGKYSASALVDQCCQLWPEKGINKFIVFTGGEPLLQVNNTLIRAFRDAGFYTAVETNGTQPVPAGLNWICVSPKENAPLKVERGNELKLVYPQGNMDPADFESLQFEHFFLQPMDSAFTTENTTRCVDYCLQNPLWKLSCQTHKYLNIP